MNRLDSSDENIADKIAQELEDAFDEVLPKFFHARLINEDMTSLTETYFAAIPKITTMLVKMIGTAIFAKEPIEVWEKWTETKAEPLWKEIAKLCQKYYPKGT